MSLPAKKLEPRCVYEKAQDISHHSFNGFFLAQN